VISWINHSTEQRAQNLPMLIEHVRLPLLSQDYLIHKVRLIKTLDRLAWPCIL
jgi:kelch-like protein 2/3